MTSNDESTTDPTDTSSTPFHFGQLVWAKLGAAPFWPAVIFTEENQDWIRQKGKSTYVHIFFFGETAERSWILTTRLLPFIGTEKFTKQRNKWRRQMKTIKQTIKLSKFSLRKRIKILKNEWWYWDDMIQSQSIIEISSDDKNDFQDDQSKLIQEQKNDTEEILQLLSNNSSELDEIICLSDTSIDNNDTQSYLKHTSSVCFHPLTSYEEEKIIHEMIASSNNSFSTSRRIAEKEYLYCIQKNFPSTSVISEHWFYLFVFRHCERLTRIFPRWIQDMEKLIVQSSFISPIHLSQIQSLIILFKQYYKNHNQK